jgi:hypothetical protein
VGDVKRHSESSWSSLAPWRRMKILEGGNEEDGIEEEGHIRMERVLSWKGEENGPSFEGGNSEREGPGDQVNVEEFVWRSDRSIKGDKHVKKLFPLQSNRRQARL